MQESAAIANAEPHAAAAVRRAPAPGLHAERYDLIDAWRGLAALAVVVHHVAHVFIGGPAVMLFFVISGYCIAASVDSCRRKGLGFGTFMMRRIRRIYPPYLLSIAFWAATRVVKIVRSGENDFARFDVMDWVQNITLTQWVSLVFHPASNPPTNSTLFVAAYWSLCYEEQFYITMGLMMLLTGLLRMSVLGMTAALMGVGLVWNIVYPETSFGFFIEYWALFGMGVLVFHRLCRIESPSLRRLIDFVLIGVAIAAAYMSWFSGEAWLKHSPEFAPAKREDFRLVYEELTIGAVFALVLIVMRPWSGAIARRVWFKPLAALGLITFSLYLIHQFNLTLMEQVSGKVLGIAGLPTILPDGSRAWYWLAMQIGMHIGLATVFWCFCERPFLNKSLLPTLRDSDVSRPVTAPRAP